MSDLMSSLAALRQAAQDPRAQMERYLAQGKKVVGCFAVYTPEELVHASGMIPFGIWGAQTELREAKRYLPAFACSIMQTALELGLRGSYRGLSAVIIPALCDTFRCVTQDWRFGVTDIPVLPIVYPQNRSHPASVEFLISEYETLLAKLSTITGCTMTEDALCRSIEVYNEHSAVMREFALAANDHLDIITPAVRHQVMKSAFFYEKAEHTAIMRDIVAGLKERPVYDYRGKRAVLTGIMAEPEALLELLHDNGIAVVADDLAQESRQYRTDIPMKGGGGVRRLALQWGARKGCSLAHEDEPTRSRMLAELCRGSGATGVIACMMKFCDPEEYDFPSYDSDLKQQGIPTLFLEIDLLNTSYEQARTRIQTFGDML